MNKNTELNAYILLDRSGSMAHRWVEALGAVNGYAAKLAKWGSVRLTVATFDGLDGLQFEVPRDGVLAANWLPLTGQEAEPRGNTPLFDAVGRLVRRAELAGAERTSIVVMTDGEENASTELTQKGAKMALARCRKRGWDVVFLGADFDAFSQAASVGVAAGVTLNTASGHLAASLDVLAARAERYAECGDIAAFTEAEREQAAGR
ncbi:vWA domain-containing protein [Geminicoccus harenae]|uniref:vWA domain-containing protein n=1 Tax=Geminicoccus harenae TaxID=2498453 RepID=UPI00168A98AE|nr:vWA domain-containing protein [Geminicoccus harenae]